MAQGANRLRRIGQGALLVFVLALVVWGLILWWQAQLPVSAPPPTATPPGPGPAPGPVPSPVPGGVVAGDLAIAVTAITAFVSLCTFIVSTVLGWRRERRESASHALALDKARLEIEKLRTEVDGLRARSSAAHPPGGDPGPG